MPAGVVSGFANPGPCFPGKKELGTIAQGEAGGIRLVQGELKIGEPLSPPLIREVKKRGLPQRLTLIDAPPGTSCPVIQAVKDRIFACW